MAERDRTASVARAVPWLAGARAKEKEDDEGGRHGDLPRNSTVTDSGQTFQRDMCSLRNRWLSGPQTKPSFRPACLRI